jgi:hypothetical protein
VSEAYKRLDGQGDCYETPTAFNCSQYLFQYRYRVVRERVTGPDALEVGVGYGDFNAMSAHRQLGVEMGMLECEWNLNEHDHAVGHRRVYTRELLDEHIRRARLTISHADGVMFKLLSNRQTDGLLKAYGEGLMEGLYRLGRRMPDLAAERHLCCTGA